MRSWAEARVPCPLCGDAPARPWAREGAWRVVRCGGCGLCLTWPRPEAAALASAYSESYYSERGMGPEAAAEWAARAREILARIPEPVARVLDYGAGPAHGMAAMRLLGISVEGVEPSPSARQEARRLHGVTLFGDLSEVPGGAFDAAVLIHSLEHVPDPLATLRGVAARVRPHGFILVEVPNAESVEMWRPSRRARLLDLPRHLFHFTPETLAALVRRAGLEVAAVHLSNPDLLEALMAWRARRRPPDSVADDARGPGPPLPAPETLSRRPQASWARFVLPRLRAAFPGWKFQLLARRAADPEPGGAPP